jgi:tricarballylate dehydrogenase
MDHETGLIKMEGKREMNSDVLIIGGGNAGLVAAIEAKNAGVNVLLLEKAPKKLRGGNSRLSTGFFRIACPRGTKDFGPLLISTNWLNENIEIEPYSKDEYYNKVLKLSEGLSDKRLMEILVEKSLETVTWMKEQGVQWDLNPLYMVKKENRTFWPSGTTVLLASGSGEGLVEMLYGIAEKRGVEVLYETSARSLIINAEGAVRGVIAKNSNGFIRIDAKQVILACGGFQANPEWRRRYLGENWDLVKLRGTRYDTGDGLKMATDIGAQTIGHWGGCHASIVSEDSPMMEAASTGSERYSYPYGIIVNRNGERFVDEGEDLIVYTYAKFGKEILKQPGSIAFQIFDAKVIPLLRAEYQDAIKVESNSLEQLAEEFDIDVQNFLETIKAFNESMVDNEKPFIPYRLDGRRTRGLKPDKTNWAQKINMPPYRGYAVVCGITMTYGGLRTNEKAQVLDTSDRPIEGFYAVGEITGGFFYHNYPGGTGLVRGAVMGRIAGAQAAANVK